MRAFVTGATGFVGSNLVAELVERGHQVRALRRPQSRMGALEGVSAEFVEGDILDPESLTTAIQGCEAVFHVAGMSQYWRSSREAIYRVNVDGTRNVMHAALAAGVRRVVHTSSVAAVGFSRRGAMADERQPFPERLRWWAYGHSKHLAEQEVHQAVRQGLEAVIVNPGMVLGPRDVNFVSGSLIRGSVRGQLRVVPPGGASGVHVSDVVAAQVAAAEQGRVGERYIVGGENLTHAAMASILSEVTGGAGPAIVLPYWTLRTAAWLVDAWNTVSRRPPVVVGDQIRLGGETFYVDSSKAVRELGIPQTPFRVAAVDAYTWYCEHGLL